MVKKIALLITLIAATATPCSFSEFAVFYFMKRPGAPVDTYVAGRLGILLPSYARTHLIVAWRYLNKKPLSTSEQQEVLEVINPRLHLAGSPREPGVNVWLAARNALAPAPIGEADLDPYRDASHYDKYYNCTDDAFRTAAATLKARANTYGPKHAALQKWIAAQDLVFSNCAHGNAIPGAAENDLPPLMRADRPYQIASAAFYAADFDAAHDLYIKIADDATSPWHQTSRLVAARALLRKATVDAPEDAFDKPTMARAEAELNAIVADANLAPLYRAAEQLLDYIHVRSEPQKQIAKMAQAINGGALTSHALEDLDFMMGRVRSDVEIADWIETFKKSAGDNADYERILSQNAEAYAHALERWRQRKSLPWLVAALANAEPNSEAVPALLDASSAIDAKSPAYLTITYHRARLLGEHARGELDRALALDDKAMPLSARNLLLALRAQVAGSFGDYLRDTPRIPVGTLSEWEGPFETDTPPAPLIDRDTAHVFNTALPLSSLIAATHREGMDPRLRRQFTIAAWTRAILLGKYDVADQLTPDVIRDVPELKDLMTSYLHANDKRFTALYVIANVPALSPYISAPDEYGRSLENGVTELYHSGEHANWWCVSAKNYYEVVLPRQRYSRTFATLPPFTAALHDESESEQRALAAHGSAATFLLRSAMEWAKERPKDERVPEALALAIQGTHWACPDDATKRLAARAFDVLHTKYGATQWAKETKYWYSGRE